MNCSEWEERVALYAGGDLAATDAGQVERHVAECAGCQILLGGLRETLGLREAHVEGVDAAHFTAVRTRVMAELERARYPWWRRAWIWVAVAVGALVLILVRPAPPPPPKMDVTPPLVERVPELPAPAPRPRIARPAPRKKAPVETVLVKLETDNPDVVIYWIAESKGETK